MSSSSHARSSHLWIWLLSGVLGVSTAMVALWSFLPPATTGWAPHLGALVFLAESFTALSYHVLEPVASRGWGETGRIFRAAWLLGTAAFAAILWVAIPVSIPDRGTVQELIIRPLADRAEASKGNEIWVQRLENLDGTFERRASWAMNGGWRRHETALLHPGGASSDLVWRGAPRGGLRLVLTRHAWSGKAEILWNGQAQRVDLFADAAEPLVLSFPVQQTRAEAVVHGLYVTAHALALWALLLGVGVLFSRWSRPQHLPGRPPSFAGLAGVASLGGLLALVAAFPGSMTSDSIDQWGQLLTGNVVDSHPAVHTATNWLLTRVWFSPAAVALAQVVAFAILAAIFGRELGRMGAPHWTIWTSTALLSLWPSVALYLVTLWKDIPYALALLGLTTCVLRAIRTDGAWLRSGAGVFWTVVSLLAVALYRHNGVLVVAGLMPSMLLVRSFRRPALVITAITAVVFGVVKGPVLRWMDVTPVPRAFALQNQVHQMAAMVAAGAELTPEDERLLGEILPLPRWRETYLCYTAAPLLYQPGFSMKAFGRNLDGFVALFRRLAPENVDALWDRQRCISSLVWRISHPLDGVLSTYTLGVQDNPHGLASTPPWPEFSDAVRRIAELSVDRRWISVFWRPGWLLYLAVACVVLAAVRVRAPRLLLVAAPLVLNSLVLMLLTPSQSVRYQMIAFLIGLFAPALLLLGAPPAPADAGPSRDEARHR